MESPSARDRTDNVTSGADPPPVETFHPLYVIPHRAVAACLAWVSRQEGF